MKREGKNVLVTVKGTYENFRGGYDLTITPSGGLSIHSCFDHAGDDVLAREMGLRFSVPRACDLIEWERRAEWRVYPPDHIGRPRGKAAAFPKNDTVVPPAVPWSQDISPMGSNDFRSTKRNIHWAAIRYAAGPGVLIDSEGHQHVRAHVESDRISVHVNDWFGGTNVGWWEWTHNYGRGRPVRKGTRIESKANLKIVPSLPSQ